jgi:hypothetical protein
VPVLAPLAAMVGLSSSHTPRELCSVPIEIHNHHVYVPVTYGANAQLSFLLDSGAAASLNIFDRACATKLGMTAEGSGSASAIGGNAKIAFANSVDLSIPPLHLKPNRVAIMDLADGQAQEGHAVDGLLGYALFQAYIVQVDYRARRLNLFAFSKLPVRKAHTKATSIPLLVRNKGCSLLAKVRFQAGGKSISLRLAVDTGFDGTIMLTSPFARKQGLLTGKATKGGGLGGETNAQDVELRDLSLGRTLHIRNIVVRASRDREGAFSSSEVDGYVGGGILDRFIVTFDYKHGELFLTPQMG